jgi:hypothetical protein
VIDAPGGGGKVPLLPEYVEEINDDEVIFRNFQGQRFTYKQPKPYDGSGTPDIVPIEIAAKKQRTAAKKASRPRRRKPSGSKQQELLLLVVDDRPKGRSFSFPTMSSNFHALRDGRATTLGDCPATRGWSIGFNWRTHVGFYIRKALKVGPLRFNLSKSGVGVSAGIKGLRLGTGPRGNYVHMGRGGLYFRKSLNSPTEHTRRAFNESRSLPSEPSYRDEPQATVGPLESIDSGSVLQMVDASSAELLRELNEKREKLRLLPIVIIFCVIALVPLLGAGAPVWIVALAIALGGAVCWFAAMKDALRKTTVILYDLDPEVERGYEHLHAAFSQLRSCARIWHIEARGEVRDRKYHAGAGAVVKRKQVSLKNGLPPFVKTNVEVPIVPVGRQTLAFMPDRLLVFDGNAVGAVKYADLTLDIAESQFVEEESLPADAAVIGRTWRYVNKKGGPDRRFNDNREIPICAYEQLRFSNTSGLDEVVQVSRRGASTTLRTALSFMGNLRSNEG